MSVWLPLATAIGGYGVKLLDDLRRERREDKRLERERQIGLEDERRHREADFQRETLLELQEALHAVLRAAASDIRERSTDAKQRGVPFASAMASPETDEHERERLGRVLLLQARVKDDEARTLTDATTSAIASPQVVLAQSARDALVGLNDSWMRFGEFNERVGWLLRERY